MAQRLVVFIAKQGSALFLILLVSFVCFDNQCAGFQEQAARTASEEGVPQENESASVDCREMATLIQQQKSMISRETGQLKREIAALRDDLSRPGIKEIFAGIGYIFGLAGVGFYIHGRKSGRR